MERPPEEVPPPWAKPLIADVRYLREKMANLDGRTATIGAVMGILASAILGAALILLAGCNVTVPSPSDDSVVVALVTASGQPYCSGSVVLGRVITAAHCVDRPPPGGLRIGHLSGLGSNGYTWDRSHTSRVLALDTEGDVAILSAPSWFPRVRLRGWDVEVGEPVTAVGHPYGFAYTRSRGTVTRGVSGRGPLPLPWRLFFFTDAGIGPGMSGGPVFDSAGQQVGVIAFTIGGEPLGGIVPASVVRDLLEDLPPVGLDRPGADTP